MGHYEINVSYNGVHFFATHGRSITSERKLKDVLRIFMKKFPESEGYGISVSYWEEIGKYVDVDKVLSEE